MKAEDFLTQDKVDKLQLNTDDNNGIIDEDSIINLMEGYHQEQLKSFSIPVVSKCNKCSSTETWFCEGVEHCEYCNEPI